MLKSKSVFLNKSATFLATTLLTACLATTVYAAEAEPAFGDVPQDHPFFTAIQTAYEQEIVSGTGNRMFQPDAEATLPQLCAMYMRYAGVEEDDTDGAGDWAEQTMAQAVDIGLVTAYEAKSTSCSWIFLLEKFLEWEELPAYSQTLWGDGTEYPGLNIPDANTVCSAKVYGLLDGIQVKDFKSSPSRGEVAQLLYNFENSTSKNEVPDIVSYFPIDFDGVGIMHINDSYSTLMDVPQFYLEKFKEKGWTFHITTKHIWQIPGFEQYSTAVGITTYGTSEIYVYAPSTGTIRHEFGHFAEKIAVRKGYPTEIWEMEKAEISELTGAYSETSEAEAFACVFAYLCQYQYNDDKIAEFIEKCPLTYEFMMDNYFTPEILSFTGEDFFVPSQGRVNERVLGWRVSRY